MTTLEVAGLDRFASLAGFPAAARDDLEAALEKRTHQPGEAIVREGDVGDRLFFLADGQTEVWTERAGGRVSLATLGPGEMFGELALFSEDGRRNATVSALTSAV